MKRSHTAWLAVGLTLSVAAFQAQAKGFSGHPGKGGHKGLESYEGQVHVVPSQSGAATLDYVEGRVFEDRNFNSEPDRRERGIAGVMVSNGYDVVMTDSKGYYRLPAQIRGLDNFTVFVTQPATHRVPTDRDNIPQNYYHHIPEGSPGLRFGGLPASGPQPSAINFPMIRGQYKKQFKIAVSGDPQPYSNNEVSYVRDALANELAARDDLELLLVEGDVIGDDLGLYPRMKQILSAAGVPVLAVPGNHDLDFDATTDANSLDTFKREFGPAYYSYDIGDVHFVVLDNMRYPCTPEVDNADGRHGFCDNPATAPRYNGIIDQGQMEWLANDLALVPRHKLIVLNMHIPLVSFVDMTSTQHQTDNTQWLYDLLGDRPAIALSGHTHTLENFRKGEYFGGWNSALGLGATPIPQIITGATSGSWWTGDLDEYNLPMSIQRLGAPRGYLIFEFFGSDYASTFKAANKPADEQMSVDFLSPTFLSWFQAMKDWYDLPADSRPETPAVNIHDLPDTSILTLADLQQGTQLVMNIWNGSRDSKVWVQIDDRRPVTVQRTQQGEGEDKVVSLDPFALKKQMYVFRYAAKSESGNERTQGFELFRGSHYGTADPQPLPASRWTQSSNHIWAFDMPLDLAPGIHVAKVTTVDAYGNRYETTKTFEVAEERPAPFFRSELFE
ncbi:MAG: calcineurin-like phosphoesterase family protein [Pseudomonadota bacterium]|nr:calcineurin-like phosphoesterase family protein [Pseudomonadota bacterium]